MLYEIADNYQSSFSPFTLYPSVSDRNAWNAVDEEWKKEAVKLGEAHLHFQYPYLSATDFMDFSRTGNRVRYEEKCFVKRHALCALVLAECVENTGRFMDDIINGIFSVCEESAWQLPPHNTYHRDAPQLLLPDSTAPVLDLFACETGAILSTAYYLLGPKFDEISPFIGKRILAELQHRIFTPYIDSHFWWMGNGKEPMNNWTIWCTQNVLLSVFLSNTDEALKRTVFQKACKSADYFLDEYEIDGCCDEGAQYYRHAGLCLFNTIELLNAVTKGAFGSLYQNPKIQNIASYILNVHIDDIYYVNFADCSPVAGRAGAREFLFAEKIGNRSMAAFAADDFVRGLPDTLLLPSENNLYYRLQNGFTVREMRTYNAAAHNSIKHPDIYYPSTGVFIARDDTLCLAVKAGGNGDNHNHNDTGSFIIYKNGLPLLIDVGVESYTKKTFSPERYDIWTMQSAYHNLPTINGYMQKDGAEYCASDVRPQLSESVCTIQMDIAAAYPSASGLRSYHREASLIKGTEIVIRDHFTFQKEDHSVILSLMTYEKPVVLETDAHLLFSIGSSGMLRIMGGNLLRIETIPITDPRLQIAWKHDIYRILIDASGAELEMRLT